MPIKIDSKEAALKFIEDHDTFLFDCDGVLWRGNTPLTHSADTLKLLRSKGKQIVFVTNNSTKSRKQYVNKFTKLGIDAKADEIFGSAYSSAVYLDKMGTFDKENKKVLVIGESGLEEELHEAGFKTLGGADPALNRDFGPEVEKYAIRDESIGAVVCGLDLKINYLKIAYAQANLRDPRVTFLATNVDSTFPATDMILPGAGTVIKSVSFCSGREPDATLGKPSKAMMDCILEKFKLDPKRTVMVGDRLNTDMKFGANSGLDTLFVLTGVDKVEEANKFGVDPTYYADKLGDIFELLE
ncbi:4-nitrophenylphosphatase [Starmerella bacillaris]|uniref:4-nitrophenylphosphatase n=1 Tax=Starmerella bacillaris TaxID=1247836 RepID=A0AAV5RFW9_STABA|nr:4-nitrophenylphosphatase [Starmerella bacillaris]